MSYMAWNDRFKVNISEIDEQHKKLFDMVNELDNSIRSGHGNEVVGKTIVALLSYAKNHFSAEEGYLKRNGYPEYEGHRKMHVALTQKAIDLHMGFAASKNADPTVLMDFLKNWLTSHILSEDMKYSPFLRGKGVA